MSVALGLPACVQGARRCAAEPRLRRRASRPAPPCAARASPVSPAVGKQVAGVSAAPSSLPPLPVPLPVATALAAAAFSTLVMLLLRPGRNNGCVRLHAEDAQRRRRVHACARHSAVAHTSGPFSFHRSSIDGLASRGVGLAEDRGVAADKFYKGKRVHRRASRMLRVPACCSCSLALARVQA